MGSFFISKYDKITSKGDFMKLKFMLKFFLIITLTTLGYIIIDSTFENIYSYNKIEEFKNECDEVSSPNKYIKFYSYFYA